MNMPNTFTQSSNELNFDNYQKLQYLLNQSTQFQNQNFAPLENNLFLNNLLNDYQRLNSQNLFNNAFALTNSLNSIITNNISSNLKNPTLDVKYQSHDKVSNLNNLYNSKNVYQSSHLMLKRERDEDIPNSQKFCQEDNNDKVIFSKKNSDVMKDSNKD